MKQIEWTEALISRFQDLYREGLSFSIIAEDLGCTRNAAIGKAHRLKFEPRDSCVSRNPGPKKPGKLTTTTVRKIRVTRRLERRFAPPEPTVAPARVERVFDPNHDYRCSIYDLDDRSCRFPLWERDTPAPQRLFCGKPGADLFAGSPYCPCHTKLCAH